MNWSRACSRSSWTNIILFYFASRRAFKSSSIWPESGLKRRSLGSKKHMLIRSTIVEIRTRRTPFWNSSVLEDFQQQKILEQKFVEMEWSAEPIGSRANIFLVFSRISSNNIFYCFLNYLVIFFIFTYKIENFNY